MLIIKMLVLMVLSMGSGVAFAVAVDYHNVDTSAELSLAVRSTDAVWSHHIAAWEARDLEAIVSDYDSESILILNGQVFRGQEAIKNVFAQLFRIFDNGQNRIDEPLLDGRIVYITWHFTPTNDVEFYGTDTFVIEDGIITVQTIASPLYDKYKIEKENN